MPEIRPGNLDDPAVVDIIRTHLDKARAATAPGSAHALDLSGLRTPDLHFWTMHDADTLLGMGALKVHSATLGEVKSMFTAPTSRGRGLASAMLRHIVAEARRLGLSRIALETGSWAYFEPARKLYRGHGFVECPPFADYGPDPNSVFMALQLDSPRTAASR